MYMVLTRKTIHSDQLKGMVLTVGVADLKLTSKIFPVQPKRKYRKCENNNGFQAHNIFFLNLCKDIFST
jgi:hypothetical protein